jgi:uncharacterized Fe-S radical SAM superfamily protein PflX
MNTMHANLLTSKLILRHLVYPVNIRMCCYRIFVKYSKVVKNVDAVLQNVHLQMYHCGHYVVTVALPCIKHVG